MTADGGTIAAAQECADANARRRTDDMADRTCRPALPLLMVSSGRCAPRGGLGGSRVRPSTSPGADGCQTPARPDPALFLDQGATPPKRFHASLHVGCRIEQAQIRDNVLLVVCGQRVTSGRYVDDVGIKRRFLHGRSCGKRRASLLLRKRRNFTLLLPKLDGATVYELFGKSDCFLVRVAANNNTIDDVAIISNHISVVT